MPEIQLTQGTVHYRDERARTEQPPSEGSGPAVVLIHGLLVDGHVWDRVIPGLSAHARCIVPDLPLGSHRFPMRETADLSPPGLASLIAEMIERLELEDVTLVGNDTGGALCQLVAARHPERLGRLVLTNCDAFENFPPSEFRSVVRGLQLPGALAGFAALGRLRVMRRATMSMMPLTVEPLPDPLVKSWVAPLSDRRVRRDLVQVLSGISSEHTIDAARRLSSFERPALIAWGMSDRFFPFSDAERLAAALPDARLERIENARTFVQIDAPDRLAELVGAFAPVADPNRSEKWTSH